MTRPDFWSDQERARETGQKLSELKEEILTWENMKREAEDLLEIAALDEKDQAVNLREEAEKKYNDLEKKLNELEFFILFFDKHDRANAIMAIHAGAGGTDAQDWAEMLLRMYLRFCEKKNFKVRVIDESRGGEAGIKSVFFEVEGRYAYGCLKSEAGVHRLVRISPFDAEKMRHTSFALVEVLPEIEEIKEIEIKPDDLRIDVYRSGGHGGQSVNTTDSAVRIVHLPTKITVTCQSERSQLQNKERAMKVLRSKVYQYYQTELEEEKQKLRGEYTEAAWGNQARSYILHPYKMVKDHRTDFEVGDAERVLDGDLDELVEAYLKSLRKK